jgi:predicted protein tyrosine phosphatase
MKLLFVCSRNRLRSPTAEIIFSGYQGIEALSAGTSVDAETQVSADLIDWAEIIFVMENHHRDKLRNRFGKLLETKRLVVLRIPDNYKYMDSELVEILKNKVCPHLSGYVR